MVNKLLLVAVTAVAFFVVTAVPAPAATIQADCTARLSPHSASWTAECAAPHLVTIKQEIWWYWLGDPSRIFYTPRESSKQVQPGTPWSERVYSVPERRWVQMCMAGYQDTTLLIAPRVCAQFPG